MPALLSAQQADLPAPIAVGKVREMFDLGDALLIVTTDRISAFDVVMANGIPDKGRVLNQISAFWFEKFADHVPHHLFTVDDVQISQRLGRDLGELSGRSAVVKKAKPLPIECVARGYLSGSLFKEYKALGGNLHGLDLPEGLMESSRLPEPIFSPATKAQSGHDENISWEQAVDLVGKEVAERARDWTLFLYTHAAHHASNKGLILADTKFEFGLTDEGLIWIDEALSPDSSRYWNAELYQAGGPQPSFDKQFVRDYLETLDWDKRPPGPTLPEDVVRKTREKYLEAFRRLTGADVKGLSG